QTCALPISLGGARNMKRLNYNLRPMEIQIMEFMARGLSVKEMADELGMHRRYVTIVRSAAVLSDPRIENFRHLFCEAVRDELIDLPWYPSVSFLSARRREGLERASRGMTEYGTKIMALCNEATDMEFEWKLLDQILAAAISQGVI
ncbi:MAG: hypothetical protein OQK82_09240, partial [Candidatus Pacearchaeota archaeon]|nr:hypothetical protein [Candidatus Pacearchaeota archaeon]